MFRRQTANQFQRGCLAFPCLSTARDGRSRRRWRFTTSWRLPTRTTSIPIPTSVNGSIPHGPLADRVNAPTPCSLLAEPSPTAAYPSILSSQSLATARTSRHRLGPDLNATFFSSWLSGVVKGRALFWVIARVRDHWEARMVLSVRTVCHLCLTGLSWEATRLGLCTCTRRRRRGQGAHDCWNGSKSRISVVRHKRVRGEGSGRGHGRVGMELTRPENFTVEIPDEGTYSVSVVIVRSKRVCDIEVGPSRCSSDAHALEDHRDRTRSRSTLPPIQYKASSETYALSRKRNSRTLPRGTTRSP